MQRNIAKIKVDNSNRYCFDINNEKGNKDDNIHRISAKNSLKSFKNQNPPPISAFFTHATIRYGFLTKF